MTHDLTATQLLSWNGTPTKEAILAFVRDVTDQTSSRVVPAVERIAVFDNDGTLWCERPIYAQFAFAFDLLAEKAKRAPDLQDQQPYRAALTGDTEWLSGYLSNSTLPAFVNMVLDATAGTTQSEFELRAAAWLKETQHPHLGVAYTRLVYRPMVELLAYLGHHGFQIYICSW